MGAGAGVLILASAHASYLTSSKSRSFVSRFSPKEVERRRSHSSPGPEESRKVAVLTLSPGVVESCTSSRFQRGNPTLPAPPALCFRY